MRGHFIHFFSFRNLRENLTEEEECATAEGDVTAFMNKAIEGQVKIQISLRARNLISGVFRSKYSVPMCATNGHYRF